MIDSTVAHRYAKSLIDLALEQGSLEKAKEEMEFVLNTIRSSKDLQLMLKNPIVKSDKKVAILNQIFEGKVGKVFTTFITLMAKKKREMYLESIAAAFIQQYKDHKNIITAVITTANGLDENLRKKVMQVVKDSVNSEVELVEKVNKDLIGGFVLRVGDKQVDASISRKLKNLNRTFNENPYIKEF